MFQASLGELIVKSVAEGDNENRHIDALSPSEQVIRDIMTDEKSGEHPADHGPVDHPNKV